MLSCSILAPLPRKLPSPIEGCCARPKQTHGVIPSCRDREAIGDFAIAASKLDGDRTIWAFYCVAAVQRIGTVFVRFKITLTAVDGDRPETADGHISNC